jgi:hypothetical protein
MADAAREAVARERLAALLWASGMGTTADRWETLCSDVSDRAFFYRQADAALAALAPIIAAEVLSGYCDKPYADEEIAHASVIASRICGGGE